MKVFYIIGILLKKYESNMQKIPDTEGILVFRKFFEREKRTCDHSPENGTGKDGTVTRNRSMTLYRLTFYENIRLNDTHISF
jgi:hypothetical protein